MPIFADFFAQATGNPPYGYQERLAHDGLPPVLEAPTASGKTAIILAWLWRLLHGPDPGATPRRLVFALPQRTLVEQVALNAQNWLVNLGLTDQVALHVVMGGVGTTQRQWRLDMHKPAIVVGTVDSLVSKALNRGYGISRAMYPIDFALVINGAHWIIDEIQLCPESTTTLRQLAAFAGTRWATAEPFGLTCMSATVSKEILSTVDNPLPPPDQIMRIEPDECVGQLRVRLGAQRTLRRLECGPGDYSALAAAALERHRSGTLTLVVVNTVEAARGVYKALQKTPGERTLLHSRFRGVDRERLIHRLTTTPGEQDHIVVSTQVVEAGIDVNASTMITEAAPWPSVVQRAGRCNRTGGVTDAELWWLPPLKPAPYPQEDIDAAVAELSALEGVAVTGEGLLARQVETTEPVVATIRRSDLLALFDTAADLSGSDIDVAPYVRDAEDLDVQLAWAVWTPVDGSGRPPGTAKAPPAQYRCRVPLGAVKALTNRGPVWRFDQVVGEWTRVSESARARPGEVLLMAAADGGYQPETGLDPTNTKPVPDCPSLDQPPRDAKGAASGAPDGYKQDDDSVGQPAWLSLDQHSDDVREQAERLLEVIGPDLGVTVQRAVVVAGHTHDLGKCHPIWQDALCGLAAEGDRAWIDANRPWAKSNEDGRLSFAGGVQFRHELVSLLLLDGPLRALLDGIDEPDLVRYLVLAHHGKLRVQVRGPDDTDNETLLGLKRGAVEPVPRLLGQPECALAVDLDQFTLGGERSWTRTALGLRDRYGPFVLAYLETLVRIADWRASAGLPLAGQDKEKRDDTA